MLTSTEDPEHFSRVSKSLIGLLLRRDTVGNLMLIPDKLGKTLCTISTPNGLPPNSLEKDKNPTLLNGSDSNNGVRVTPQDFSTMKSQNQPGSDTEVTWMKQTRLSILSLMLIKSTNSLSVLIPLPQRAESNSKRNGKPFAKWLLSFFPKRIWSTLMNNNQC